MTYATKENTNIGDTVLVPIHGEFMQKEQICQEYEVVVTLKCKTKPENQIVATGEPPMPEYLEFNDEIALKMI